MYMIVALVYIIIGGAPYGEAVKVNHKTAFTSLEKCIEHLKSDEFGKDRVLLTEQITNTFVEMRTEANAEGAPLPAVVITASCEKDQRV